MTRIWAFTPWFPYELDMVAFAKCLEILNGWDVFNARQPVGTMWTNFPLVRLKMSSDGFDVDCFDWEGYIFVSEKLRQALALNLSAVQYLEVDSSQSHPIPNAKRYEILNVPVVEEIARGGGAVPPEAEPQHSLFFCQQSPGQLFCTDALAVRVLSAGCVGIRFLHPAHLGIARPSRYRTLRGVEEGGDWDPVRKVVHSTVVEHIN